MIDTFNLLHPFNYTHFGLTTVKKTFDWSNVPQAPNANKSNWNKLTVWYRDESRDIEWSKNCVFRKSNLMNIECNCSDDATSRIVGLIDFNIYVLKHKNLVNVEP